MGDLLIDFPSAASNRMRNALVKSLDLACLQPKSCDLTNGKASLKFNALVGDRQVIADERFGVSRFVFKRRVRLLLGHRSVQSRLRVFRSLHGN
jgi:hypothetical protein